MAAILTILGFLAGALACPFLFPGYVRGVERARLEHQQEQS